MAELAGGAEAVRVDLAAVVEYEGVAEATYHLAHVLVAQHLNKLRAPLRESVAVAEAAVVAATKRVELADLRGHVALDLVVGQAEAPQLEHLAELRRQRAREEVVVGAEVLDGLEHAAVQLGRACGACYLHSKLNERYYTARLQATGASLVRRRTLALPTSADARPPSLP